jgi:hypothetical protein
MEIIMAKRPIKTLNGLTVGHPVTIISADGSEKTKVVRWIGLLGFLVNEHMTMFRWSDKDKTWKPA